MNKSSLSFGLVVFAFLAVTFFISITDTATVSASAGKGSKTTLALTSSTRTPPMSCAANSILKSKGCWDFAFGSGPVVHAVVVPDGKSLNWSSFGPHGFARIWECDLVGPTGKKLCSRVPDNVDLYTDPVFQDFNIFCSGHSMLADGRVMITGGVWSETPTPTPATPTPTPATPTPTPTPMEFSESKTLYFDHDASGSKWQLGPNMWEGRWYPTNVALGDGSTLVVSGTFMDEPNNWATASNKFPEVLANGGTTWTKLTGAERQLPLYPWLYYATNGLVFYAGPTTDTGWLNTSGTGSWSPTPTPSNPLLSSVYRESGSSVMYDVDKIMNSGGGFAAPVNTTEIIDLGAGTPDWQPAASMNFARKHHNLTILADGTVLATGGTKGIGFNNNCDRQVVYEAELWNPTANTWTTMGRMSHNRRYHSTAWLLRDGRVMVGGSDGYPSTPVQCTPTLPTVYETEIFTPPYLFDGSGNLATRPEVLTMPTPPSGESNSLMTYGSPFSVTMTTTTAISKVTLVRLSAVTHSFNMNQRFNNLAFSQSSANLTITPPASLNYAPKGHYMLFIIDGNGVPSVAEIIRLG